MAYVQCGSCYGFFSESAAACPRCGRPRAYGSHTTSGGPNFAAIGIIAAAAVAVIVGVSVAASGSCTQTVESTYVAPRADETQQSAPIQVPAAPAVGRPGRLVGLGSGKAFVFPQLDDLKEYGKRVRAGDQKGAVEIVNARGIVVPAGTPALVIEKTPMGHIRAQIASGPSDGAYGWTYEEAYAD